MDKIIVVRELYAEEKKRWFGHRLIVIPYDVDAVNETCYSISSDGKVSVMANSDARINALKNGHRVFAVSKKNIAFSMVFENVRHEDSYDWCFNIEGYVFIQESDIDAFLNKWKDMSGVRGLDSNTFLDNIYTIISPEVKDIINQETRKIKEIEQQDVLPATYWAERLNNYLRKNGLIGINISVTHKTFFSPDAEMIKKIKEEEEAKRAAEDAKIHEAEISAQTRSDEIAALRRDRELAELEHQKKVAELKSAIEFYENQKLQIQYKNLLEAQSELIEFISQQNGNVEKMQSALEEVKSKIESMSAKIKQTPQNVEIIVDPVVAPRYQGMSDNFLEVMSQIKSRAKNGVSLSYQVRSPCSNYNTRSIISNAYVKRTLGDIGRNDNSNRNDVLHLKDGVTIRLSSERSGYLTLINIGTSPNTVNKIFPDRNLGAISRHIDANRTYVMPGDLISCPNGMEWWPVTGATTSDYGLKERVLAIVTDEEVDIDINNIGSICARGGFHTVEEKITSFLELLKLPPDSWSWGYIEAEVVR